MLPKPGGLLDQNPFDISKLQTVLRALDDYDKEQMTKESNKKS